MKKQKKILHNIYLKHGVNIKCKKYEIDLEQWIHRTGNVVHMEKFFNRMTVLQEDTRKYGMEHFDSMFHKGEDAAVVSIA